MIQLPQGLPVDTVLLILYHYLPNRAAAAAAVALYALVSVAAAAVTVRTRCWYMLLVPVTGLLELAGWATRVAMLSRPDMSTHIVEQALLIISPVLLAVVEYCTLALLLQLAPSSSSSSSPPAGAASAGTNSNSHQVRPSYALQKCATSSGSSMDSCYSCTSAATPGGSVVVPTAAAGTTAAAANTTRSSSTGGSPVMSRLVVWCFTASDVFCLLFQTAGGALYANPDLMVYARLLLLVGLGAQLVFFTAFIVLTVFVQRSARFGFRGTRTFRPVFVCLHATALLLHLRNIFRVAEFAQGHGGDAARNETFLFVFDFAPVFASVLLFTVLHFGWWLGPNAPAWLARQPAAEAAALAAVGSGKPAPASGVPAVSLPEVDAGSEVLHIHCS